MARETMEDRRPGVELEMIYTSWDASCQDPAYLGGSPDGLPDALEASVIGSFRECRRPKHHAGPHASGFGKFYREWGITYG